MHQRDGCRTQNVAGGIQAAGEVGEEADSVAEFDRVKKGDRCLSVGAVIKLARLGMAAVSLFARIRGVFFLEPCGVAQDDGDKARGVGGAEHGPGEAVTHEGGEITAVVQMGVGENHGFDARRGEGEGVPVAFADLAGALKHSAVHQNYATLGLHREP